MFRRWEGTPHDDLQNALGIVNQGLDLVGPATLTCKPRAFFLKNYPQAAQERNNKLGLTEQSQIRMWRLSITLINHGYQSRLAGLHTKRCHLLAECGERTAQFFLLNCLRCT